MARNVEIKARVADPQALEDRAAALASEASRLLEQEDVFFVTPKGRLKLRSMTDGTAELIYYERSESSWPAASDYELARVSDAAAIRVALGRALGVRGVVRKRRRLYRVGQTRIHLDRVEGLGDFMELEVVLRDDQSEEDGTHIADELMRSLGIDESDLVDGAYIDLLGDAGR